MYKLTLRINIKNKTIELTEFSKELETMLLQNDLEKIVLLNLQKNQEQDLVFAEVIKEKDGEYYDSDNAWVKASHNYEHLEIYL